MVIGFFFFKIYILFEIQTLHDVSIQYQRTTVVSNYSLSNKMYKTVNISLDLYTGYLCCGHLSTFSNKSDDRNLNIYWLTLSLRCSHAVYEVFEVVLTLPSDFHTKTVIIT